ncbi:hypothetical protein FGIG_06494 [Fasciola gigantica]|uniref:Uncharacterized protein n=1 Tax=Fasciola gigantica TaxID=46835 RepID=A0A504YLC1_FASGI|nr:hypothetical protein FGIG_06494 [Fasciola gigantica]
MFHLRLFSKIDMHKSECSSLNISFNLASTDPQPFDPFQDEGLSEIKELGLESLPTEFHLAILTDGEYNSA